MRLKNNEFIMELPRYKGSRSSRYLEIGAKSEATMNRLYLEFFDHFVKGKECTPIVRQYIVDAAKMTKNSDDYLKGLIAEYDGQYLVCFLNVDDLDTSALKITHNEKERKLFRAFMSGCSNTALNAFYAISLRLLKEKQRIRAFKGENNTAGIIYSNYPEEDIVIDGFMQYVNINIAKEKACAESVELVRDTLDKGISYEELSEILPKDADARFLNREFDELERAQIEALEPGIAQRV